MLVCYTHDQPACDTVCASFRGIRIDAEPVRADVSAPVSDITDYETLASAAKADRPQSELQFHGLN